jgi:hypothetical protein
MIRFTLLTLTASLVLFAQPLFAQPLEVRAVIDRTQNDLRQSEDFERHHGKEVARYQNAQRHLSEFDKEFTRGHFDKGKLDTAIDDVKNVVDHNTLNPEGRDALDRDLRDLRGVRAEHDRR